MNEMEQKVLRARDSWGSDEALKEGGDQRGIEG